MTKLQFIRKQKQNLFKLFTLANETTSFNENDMLVNKNCK